MCTGIFLFAQTIVEVGYRLNLTQEILFPLVHRFCVSHMQQLLF